jgi:hypothetical protein
MGRAKTMEDYKKIALELKERRKGEDPATKLGWYMRYMPPECTGCYNDYLVDNLKPSLLDKKDSDKEKESEIIPPSQTMTSDASPKGEKKEAGKADQNPEGETEMYG